MAAVEIDPLVHEAARTYFSFPTEMATLHFEDARAFLERAVGAGETFDVIIMDVTSGFPRPCPYIGRRSFDRRQRAG